MKRRHLSAVLSLVICAASGLLLLAWVFTFPRFFSWFYLTYHGIAENPYTLAVQRRVIGAFYGCAPFAAASLYCGSVNSGGDPAAFTFSITSYSFTGESVSSCSSFMTAAISSP